MFYLLLSILFTTALVIVFKIFERYEIDNFQAIVFNYITAGLICFLLVGEPINIDQITSEEWFPSTLLIGILFISLFNVVAYSAQKVGIAITSVATKISLCIPVIFGFWYFGDSMNSLKVAGIILALLSVYFTAKKEEKRKSINPILFIVPIILFFGSGILDIILIYSLETYDLVNQGLELQFSSILYSVAGLIGMPILVFRHFTVDKIQKKNIIAGIGLGIPNVLSIVFFLKCLNHFPESTFVFPINNMGIVAASAIFASLLFKEHLSKINWFGIVIAMLSILLISAS
jgi:drug/metabolite transporter (DMT)-like permease